MNYQTGDPFAESCPSSRRPRRGTRSGARQPDARSDAEKTEVKCVDTIAKARGKIFKEILKNSTKCQAGLDKTATMFGALAPSCIDQV
jgi:hypothetical protein